ncbi:type II toxin-antitoxin system RelE/ParE family toxin [Aquabacterium sp.]|uniref:type II toxin-antitoxin system RelE/ParE family toxin n=1 Tax=Aquabacterium sp. TaxID=1872578 RepID=UPI002C77F1BE|nr:type II toxin-antitoxin system RelE/ParE family toxin [Aquabacterium sp.]HSW05097.1 type II toxin-antitoxin system RelE/ParE family toxin [Aquabacterium sp.]
MIKKDIAFVGTALEELRAFPLDARREAGFQLDRVQDGLQPDDWKPMSSVGLGVQEIRVRDESGAYRVIYVAKFADAVYVLHAFQKKTQRTSRVDIELAIRRYAEVLKEQRK